MFNFPIKYSLLTLGSLILTLVSTTTLANVQSSANLTIAQGQEMMNHGNMMNHNMSLGPSDAQYDLRFIDAMIIHHQGAVEMSKEALTKYQHPEIKKLAQEIITAQKQEIAQMKKWRQAWYPKADSIPIAWQSETNHSMAMTSNQKQMMMMSMDLGQADAKFDLRFINAMIPHHEGAITMAQDALTKSTHVEIKQLAKDILATQQKEIDLMKKWRQAWYG
jgi:uncharacterized protein (DUF305 family)